jgi:hypothetical protein
VFLSGALQLEDQIMARSFQIREKSKVAYDADLLDSRLSLMAVFAYLLTFRAGVPGITDARVSEALSLIVVFVQGATVTETLISEGQYVKAATVLKQDVELLARVREVQKGIARYGATPNVKHTKYMGSLYSDLNNVAHVAKIDLLQRLVSTYENGDAKGVSPIPEFSEQVAKGLYQLHVMLLLEISREAIKLFLEMYPSDTAEIMHAMLHWLSTTKRFESAGVFETLKQADNR